MRHTHSYERYVKAQPDLAWMTIADWVKVVLELRDELVRMGVEDTAAVYTSYEGKSFRVTWEGE